MKDKKLLIAFIIGSIIQLCGLVLLAVNFMESNDRDRLKQVEIDGLNKRIKEQADSMSIKLKLTSDSLQIAKNTILYQFYQIENERTEKEYYKKNTHEKIRFVDLVNNAGRDSVLSELYPSFRFIR